MLNKVVCFFGHRDEWHVVGIEQKLEKAIEDLILNGYNVFYDGNKGAFDNLSLDILDKMKKKYTGIKIYRILSYYNHNKSSMDLPFCIDGTILPEIEDVYYKRRITERNKWMINHSDVVVCHITETVNSGAYNAVKYAEKKGKSIIYL